MQTILNYTLSTDQKQS